MPQETIPALLLHAVKSYDKPDAFQHKQDGRYANTSHRQVMTSADNAGKGLLALNLARGDRVALLSENRLQWVIADFAILSNGCINVPIYATLPASQVEYILKDAEARAIFVSCAEQLDKILAIRKNLPNLQHIIVFDEAGNGEVTTLAELERNGAESSQPDYEERIATIGKNDWASIIYTSGTTGAPKGTILTHWNFVSNVHDGLADFDLGPGDRCLSFLPLSHVLERTGGYYCMLYRGVTIAFAESIDKVADNMREVRPTVMISVPRLYEKIYARILDAVTSGPAIKTSLFFWAVAVGKRYVFQKLENRLTPLTKIQHKIADRLVFRKLRARTGGRLRFFVSGGAPLAREIAEFFYAAGLPIVEGYGLTETSPVLTLNTFEHFRFGTVGRPIRNVEIRIADDGEILARGPNIMQGYYKKPDLTEQVIVDGWFRTGDIGHIDGDGFLTITDRKKDIIVTAGGKNVAPQPIENLFKTSKYITQVVVVGNKRKFISAIIVPNMDNVHAFATAAGISSSDDASLIREPKVIEKMHAEIERLSEHLASFEHIKKFILLENDFVDGNELTPTLKVKRSFVEKKFAKEIDALYD